MKLLFLLFHWVAVSWASCMLSHQIRNNESWTSNCNVDFMVCCCINAIQWVVDSICNNDAGKIALAGALTYYDHVICKLMIQQAGVIGLLLAKSSNGCNESMHWFAWIGIDISEIERIMKLSLSVRMLLPLKFMSYAQMLQWYG